MGSSSNVPPPQLDVKTESNSEDQQRLDALINWPHGLDTFPKDPGPSKTENNPEDGVPISSKPGDSGTVDKSNNDKQLRSDQDEEYYTSDSKNLEGGLPLTKVTPSFISMNRAGRKATVDLGEGSSNTWDSSLIDVRVHSTTSKSSQRRRGRAAQPNAEWIGSVDQNESFESRACRELDIQYSD
ncbi:hypothetical protein EV356DRAFT_575923 [Viridothelium virens]|uniref:Uncharacterized protein n=1 Tax=Viridothelium virens TaxID=1048519 RepID=A0A6A6HAU5_VIRVR|nr:hypothetical protein EV356DRAFT_575923 [Viridothelium virens]